jgi:hypothetical protein
MMTNRGRTAGDEFSFMAARSPRRLRRDFVRRLLAFLPIFLAFSSYVVSPRVTILTLSSSRDEDTFPSKAVRPAKQLRIPEHLEESGRPSPTFY